MRGNQAGGVWLYQLEDKRPNLHSKVTHDTRPQSLRHRRLSLLCAVVSPSPCVGITYLLLLCLDYTITYYSDAVQNDILALPDTLAMRYIVVTRWMIMLDQNLEAPHTKAFCPGRFESRLTGTEGIAWVFFCTLVGKGSSCCIASSRNRKRRLLGIVRSLRCV